MECKEIETILLDALSLEEVKVTQEGTHYKIVEIAKPL